MENRIQELTDKIFQEGVEKGNLEAKKILDNAKSEAERIVEEARATGERIVKDARKKADELSDNVKSELKLYSEQSVNALKTAIVNVVSDKILKECVGKSFADKEFLNRLVVEIARKWSENENITVSSTDAEGLRQYFMQNAKELLDKGVKIESVNGKKAFFSIAPSDGAYKVNFGEEEFMNYFKDFLRPQLIDILF